MKKFKQAIEIGYLEILQNIFSIYKQKKRKKTMHHYTRFKDLRDDFDLNQEQLSEKIRNQTTAV